MLDLNKFFQCAVCGELKNNLREAQCCHKLYCQDCIQRMKDNCPTCQQGTSFVENSVVSQIIRNKLSDDSTTENYRSPLGFLWRIFGRNEDKAFRVTVLTLENRKINIYVEPSDTIKILMLKVQQKDGIAPEHQRLIFQGKQLEDHNTISDYKIVRDETIHLVKRYNSG